MSEIIPPSDSGQQPTPPAPIPIPPAGAPPSKKFCTGLGALIFIVSSGLSFAIPPICLLGLAVAIGSLFYKGYRCIFIGYILTFGICLLGLIIYCSNHPFEDR